MSNANEVRNDVAAVLTAALDGVRVYPAGADVVAAPAVVLNPNDPYMVPVSFGPTPNATTIAVGLEIWCVVGRPGPAGERIGELEALRKRVTDALHGATPPGQWAEFGQFGTIEIAGVEHASGRLEYIFRVSDG